MLRVDALRVRSLLSTKNRLGWGLGFCIPRPDKSACGLQDRGPYDVVVCRTPRYGTSHPCLGAMLPGWQPKGVGDLLHPRAKVPSAGVSIPPVRLCKLLAKPDPASHRVQIPVSTSSGNLLVRATVGTPRIEPAMTATLLVLPEARPQAGPTSHPIARRQLASLGLGERRPTGTRAAGHQAAMCC